MTEILVRFWGARGTIACPGREFARYGGNTACVEVRCGDHLVIFDGGTGARPLGNSLVRSERRIDADIFLSHFHIDHVSGLLLFAPLFVAQSRVRFWAGTIPAARIQHALKTLMAEPLYPTGTEVFKASITFNDFRAGETLRPHSRMTVKTAPLKHPGRATGYRLEYGSKSIAYITDTEHRPGELDRNVMQLAAGADLMIYDGTYTDAEWPLRVGWGHSTWEEGVRLAEAARARTLIIFHHDPDHDDCFLDQVAAEASMMRPGTMVAAEGMTLLI